MSTLAEATLTDVERGLLDRVVELLRADFRDELDSVWLYGSRARGEPWRWDSDVDVLVLTRTGSSEDQHRAIELVSRAHEELGTYGTDLRVKVRDRDWLAGRRAIESFFIQEVDRDKIVLVGEP